MSSIPNCNLLYLDNLIIAAFFTVFIAEDYQFINVKLY